MGDLNVKAAAWVGHDLAIDAGVASEHGAGAVAPLDGRSVFGDRSERVRIGEMEGREVGDRHSLDRKRGSEGAGGQWTDDKENGSAAARDRRYPAVFLLDGHGEGCVGTC